LKKNPPPSSLSSPSSSLPPSPSLSSASTSNTISSTADSVAALAQEKSVEKSFYPKALWTAVKKHRVAKYVSLMLTQDKPLVMHFEIERPHSYYYAIFNHVSKTRTPQRAALPPDTEHNIAKKLASQGTALLSLDEIIRQSKQFIDSSGSSSMCSSWSSSASSSATSTSTSASASITTTTTTTIATLTSTTL